MVGTQKIRYVSLTIRFKQEASFVNVQLAVRVKNNVRSLVCASLMFAI